MYIRPPLILCYHAVSPSWPSSLAVSENLLASHVGLLRSRGYVGLTFAEAERRRRDGTLPRRSVVVTFDDGYASTLRAKPILDALGFPATVFVVTAFVESGELLRWPGVEHWGTSEHAAEMASLRWSELEALAEAGWEIGSHTVTHARLVDESPVELERELTASRRAIEERLGRCETAAYPYGVADARVAAAARLAGYLAACTLTSAHTVDEPLRRPRVGLYPHDVDARARLKLSPVTVALRRTWLARAAEHARGAG